MNPANDLAADKKDLLLKLEAEKEKIQTKIDVVSACLEGLNRFNTSKSIKNKKTDSKNIPVIFVSGPFRGKNAWEVEQNIRSSEELYLKVWELGAAAVCPNITARFLNGALENDNIWLSGELVILSKCDAVIFGEHYKNSSGSMLEYEFAKLSKMSLFYQKEESLINYKSLKEYIYNFGDNK